MCVGVYKGKMAVSPVVETEGWARRGVYSFYFGTSLKISMKESLKILDPENIT